MEFTVIFDVGQSEFRNWCFVVSGLILTAISGDVAVSCLQALLGFSRSRFWDSPVS